MSNADENDEAEAHYLRALALWEAGNAKAAADALDLAMQKRPNFPEALAMGGYILEQNGSSDAAMRFYLRATSLKPDLTSAWSNLGKILFQRDRSGEALAAFDAALVHAPFDADLHNSRSGALRKLGWLSDSEAAAREALRLRPRFPEAALNLGTALLKQGAPSGALEAYQAALSMRADWGDALNGKGLALRALDRVDEARIAFDEAIGVGNVEAVSALGCIELMLGNFELGWEGYERRWWGGRPLSEAIGSRYPNWRAPGREGERVLVLNDHGLGDTIMFCRYLPLLGRLGADPLLVVPSKLHRLLAPLGTRLAATVPEAERFDSQLALSSAPFAFGTRLDSIPARTPYLFPEPALIGRWAARIGGRGYRIGIVWQGNPDPEADAARSFPLAAVKPVATLPGVRIISLQKGFGEQQMDESLGFSIERLGPDFDGGPDAFVDTAAVMASLDLAISCDTSIAHLAGALGRPIWLALKKDAEWRWMRSRDDSPWYPTMRLFRQRSHGDWEGVFADMATVLAELP